MVKPLPLLAVLAGIPGSGKTTLAHGITSVRGFEIVSRDKIRLDIDPDWDQPVGKVLAFDMLCMKIEGCLQEGRSVIAEGMPFSRRSERRRLQAIAELHEARFLILWLDVAPRTAALRIEGDANHPAKDRSPEAAHAVSARFESFDDDERAVRIDGTKDRYLVLATAIDAIENASAYCKQIVDQATFLHYKPIGCIMLKQLEPLQPKPPGFRRPCRRS